VTCSVTSGTLRFGYNFSSWTALERNNNNKKEKEKTQEERGVSCFFTMNSGAESVEHLPKQQSPTTPTTTQTHLHDQTIPPNWSGLNAPCLTSKSDSNRGASKQSDASSQHNGQVVLILMEATRSQTSACARDDFWDLCPKRPPLVRYFLDTTNPDCGTAPRKSSVAYKRLR